MKGKLDLTTCDRCQQPIKKGERCMVVVEGGIIQSGQTLTFDGSCVRHAYHFDCWNDIKQDRTTLPAGQFAETTYRAIPKENLIVFSVRSVNGSGEPCSFERLVKECFRLFPKAFGFSRYPQWPDSLKLDRQLRTLRGRGWLVGSARNSFALTEFGEAVAEETERQLLEPEAKARTRVQTKRVDMALVHLLRDSQTFARFLADKEHFALSDMELRALLQCTMETPKRVVKQNLQYCKNIVAECGDVELLEFLNTCERELLGG